MIEKIWRQNIIITNFKLKNIDFSLFVKIYIYILNHIFAKQSIFINLSYKDFQSTYYSFIEPK